MIRVFQCGFCAKELIKNVDLSTRYIKCPSCESGEMRWIDPEEMTDSSLEEVYSKLIDKGVGTLGDEDTLLLCKTQDQREKRGLSKRERKKGTGEGRR